MFRREGAEPQVSPMFYRVVVQKVLLFGAETWVFSEAMYSNMEVVHVGLLGWTMEQRAVRQEDGTWRQVSAEKFLDNSVTPSPGTYIDRRQETVSEWVALRPILEVCDRETCYEGG